MSQYSRAAVVQRADAANVKAALAVEETLKLRSELQAQRRTVESRLAATLTLARREYDPLVRLANAGFLARWRWLLTGRLLRSTTIQPPVPGPRVSEAEHVSLKASPAPQESR